MNGGPQESGNYRLNGTSGQALVSGGYATNQWYHAALGFWSLFGSDVTQPPASTTTAQLTDNPTMGATSNPTATIPVEPTGTAKPTATPTNNGQHQVCLLLVRR